MLPAPCPRASLESGESRAVPGRRRVPGVARGQARRLWAVGESLAASLLGFRTGVRDPPPSVRDRPTRVQNRPDRVRNRPAAVRDPPPSIRDRPPRVRDCLRKIWELAVWVWDWPVLRNRSGWEGVWEAPCPAAPLPQPSRCLAVVGWEETHKTWDTPFL